MNHVIAEEWLKALWWLYGDAASASRHKTLNGSTINCIIKELLSFVDISEEAAM